MDFDELWGFFIGGVIIGILVNSFFPFLLSLTIQNTSSLSLPLRAIFLLIPLLFLAFPVITTLDSIESFIAGIFGVLFSIFVLRSIGVTEVVLTVAIVIVIILWIHDNINR